MSTPLILTLDCGTFDGSVAASRWLVRLKWDFERAGHDPTNVPASQYIKILNMQCEKDAATYLDSVPHLSAIVEKADEGRATIANVTTLDAALKERFPARIMGHVSSAGDINSLH
ncbi:hypothetical protein CABS01_06773 [Colletotrichum abscissum]|uniref:Uncharacterized protein n=1 Tax=Colletotrichum abscissum TaxID=1671311 RepID=A0A9Q0AWV1_9PEZI|nr:uncharacterized protein CABS01_06773 [Colletotrichum abscissum]KAI3540886.1 hypothetical protein CABS02_10911 [Colletotrichum abscissum]KAK1514794.1 hypothetical protein CABS01_06773 [Colletotrichum abscissum]